MKLLFVHGGEKVKEDKDGTLYTGGSYSQEIWDRYLKISDEFSMIQRKDTTIYEVDYAKEKFNYFDKERINFISVSNHTSSIKDYLNIKEHIRTNTTIQEMVLKSDCVIARLPSPYGNTAVRTAIKFNKPYLIEVVGCPWDALWNHSYKGKVLALPSYMSMKKSIINAPYALYVTNEFLQTRYPCRGKTIGCSDVLITSLDEKILEKRKLKITKLKKMNKIILGTVGAIDVKYKGQQYIIEAIARLNKKGYNFEYHMVGDGNNDYLRSIAEKYNISSKVKFLGSYPHKEVFQFLDNIDMYIQPSKTEGLPRALVEAMSRGCPVMGTAVGGIPELVDKELTFKAGAIDEMCNILMKMDKDMMIKEAVRSFEKAKEYEKDRLEKKRNKFYEEFRDAVMENNIFNKGGL